jgi:Tfp pilus assembly protein PilP
MNMRYRLVWLIAAMVLSWGCQDSSQMDKPQVVRRKIAAESSGVSNPQQSTSTREDTGSSTGRMKKEVSSQTSTSSVDPATALMASKDTSAVYRYRGSLDPFLPLIKEEKSKSPPNVVSSDKPQTKKRVPQTPLEKIDLSQLTLTAIFRHQKRTVAMVEESTGKGHLVKKGTYIGLDGGRVTEVSKDRILITEVSADVMGKPVTVERELKLRQFSGE